MDEHSFHLLKIDTLNIGVPRHLGLWAHMVTLVDILGPIQDLNRSLVKDKLTAEDSESAVENLTT